MAPTIFLGLRLISTAYVYEDPDHPNRPTSAVQSPAYVPEDQGLFLGLARYEESLCLCGVPKSVAWHSDMDGWFDGQVDGVVCHACTAALPEPADGSPRKPVIYMPRPRNTFEGVLPPFVFGETTTPA